MEKQTRKFVPRAVRLMEQVREVLRFHHYAYSTEKSYISWILKYIRFHNKKHPKDTGKAEIEAFLSHLAMNRNVSAATQNQAFSALLFLYKQVFGIDLPADICATRAQVSQCLPVALSREKFGGSMLISRVPDECGWNKYTVPEFTKTTKTTSPAPEN